MLLVEPMDFGRSWNSLVFEIFCENRVSETVLLSQILKDGLKIFRRWGFYADLLKLTRIHCYKLDKFSCNLMNLYAFIWKVLCFDELLTFILSEAPRRLRFIVFFKPIQLFTFSFGRNVMFLNWYQNSFSLLVCCVCK